jgi:hypothetical protein
MFASRFKAKLKSGFILAWCEYRSRSGAAAAQHNKQTPLETGSNAATKTQLPQQNVAAVQCINSNPRQITTGAAPCTKSNPTAPKQHFPKYSWRPP